jgi:DNA-binding transcriptional ArsR family regulator
MPFPATIEQPVRESLRVSLQPAGNAIASMLLVLKEEEMPNASTWVAQTRSQLTADELLRHRLVIIGFFYVVLPDAEWPSFPNYLDHLEKTDAVALRKKMLDTYASICFGCDEIITKTEVNWDTVLSSADHYVQFLLERFGERHVEVELENQAYEYVIDPEAMKALIVGHLRWFWEEHLAQEWAQREPILLESTKAFDKLDTYNKSRLEVARYITGQDLDEASWEASLEEAKRVLFIPNPHIGPYVTKMHIGNTLSVIFGARQPEDASVRIPELDRADIVARMSALSDDTRLRILQMIAKNSEMRSQDIIEEVALSQPSVSRYLTQLTVTGYLQERRVNGAKAYTLNRDRIEKTLRALHKFLLGT